MSERRIEMVSYWKLLAGISLVVVGLAFLGFGLVAPIETCIRTMANGRVVEDYCVVDQQANVEATIVLVLGVFSIVGASISFGRAV